MYEESVRRETTQSLTQARSLSTRIHPQSMAIYAYLNNNAPYLYLNNAPYLYLPGPTTLRPFILVISLLILLSLSAYHCMCPHTTIYVSAYY